jgi:tetratricopeptide (TPR) repeat protein
MHDVTVLMARAVVAHQRGDLDPAERDYRHVLAAAPAHPDATHFLGLLLHQRGRSAEALPLLDRSLLLAPTNPQYRSNFAGVLNRLGRGAEAVRFYREALELKPDYLDALINLGMLYAGRGDYMQALPVFDSALAVDPASYAAWYSRAETLQQLARTSEAIEAYRRAAAAAAQDPRAQLTLASALREVGALEEAQHCCERALELNPGYAEAENSLGNVLSMRGDLAGAERHFRSAIRLQPGHAGGYHNLADLKRLTPEDPMWPELMRLAARASELPPEQAISLHFALGKVWEAQGDYPRAFTHLAAGNRLKRSTLNYDEARQRRFFEDFIRVFDADFMQRRTDAGGDDERPLFIVGMPRSGTTLVEQILASHSAVHGAGEMHALRNCLRLDLPPDNDDYDLPQQLAGLAAPDFRRIAERYSGFLGTVAPASAERVTNKLPGNMVFVGLIHILYPRARIIHCRREPLDTCLSCFSKLFSTGYPFSYELGELGRFYRMYDALMAGWRSLLPGRMWEISYEELVGDVEGETRRLLEYCGLPWDDACLKFYDSPRAVRTASLAQVRKPIYAGSIGRWRHYAKELAPLREALSQ